MQKTIFVLQGKSSVGKTTTIKKIYNLLINELSAERVNANSEVLNKNDIRVILKIDNVYIGIGSEGDPGSELDKNLEIFVKNQCQIIICACRTRGRTVDWINKYSNEFKIEWIRKNPSNNQDESNEKYAKEVVKRISSLINVKHI